MNACIHLFNENLFASHHPPHYVIGTILGAGVTAGKRIGISYCPGAYVPTGEPGTSI